jgi:type IV pilus assembly protein PilC
MSYQYEAYTPDKRIVRGTIEASSETMAEEILYRTQTYRVLKLREIRPGLSLERLVPSLFGVKSQDVIGFSRQLATLMESGMPIITSLHLLEKQTPRAALRRVIARLNMELQGGSSLSQALSKFPQVFSNIYCQVIKASEYTGNLANALGQAADYIEKNIATATRIKRAFAYPVLVLLMSVAVFAIVANVAAPPLTRLFTSLGAELPWTTRLLVLTTDFVADYRYYLLGGLAALVILIAGYLRRPAGRLARDKLLLKIPIVGQIIVQRHMSRLCHTMSLLLEVGVPIPQTMSIVTGSVSNRIIHRALMEVREKLVQGQGFSQPMSKNVLFPELLVEMVAVGEKTGTLQPTLTTLSDFYEQAAEQKTRTLISILQHSLTVLIGLMVAFIGISMVTPLYSILQSIR